MGRSTSIAIGNRTYDRIFILAKMMNIRCLFLAEQARLEQGQKAKAPFPFAFFLRFFAWWPLDYPQKDGARSRILFFSGRQGCLLL
jgi:hypothetical protein